MIAVDTNVVLRYVLQDHKAQSGRASRLFSANDAILIPDVVLVEVVWVLTGRKYRISRTDVVLLVQSLIQEPNVRFEDGQRVWQALSLYRRAPRRKGQQADFADVLILLCSRAVVEVKGDPFDGWYTFDQGARLLDGALAP